VRIIYWLFTVFVLVSCSLEEKKQIQLSNLKSDWIAVDSTRLIFEDENVMFDISTMRCCQYYGSYKLNVDTLVIFSEAIFDSDRRCTNGIFKIIKLTSDELILKNLTYIETFVGDKEFYIFKKYNAFKNTEQIANLEFSATMCFGYCPVFDMKITDDSLIIIKGYKFVKRIGLSEIKLDSIQFQRLNNLFNKIDLSNIELDASPPDAPTHSIYIKTKTKKIIESSGGNAVSNYDLQFFLRYLNFIRAKFNFRPSDKANVKFRDDFNSKFMMKN